MNNPRLTRIFVAIASTLLIIAIILNIILYRQANQYYRTRNRIQLAPIGLRAYPTDASDAPAKSSHPRVVFFGDSRAQQWPSPEVDGMEFINRGIGSQTSAQVRHRFNQHVAPLAPDVIVVQVGVNDLKTVPLFPEQRDEIVANTKENITTIVERSHELGATVILTTIFPLGDVPLARRLVWSADVAVAIAEVNTYLRTLADDRVLLFETGPILADNSGVVRDAYQFDLLHLNRAGYDALNDELMHFLAHYG